MKQSLPSFVDLLSSLGLNDKDQPPPSSQLQARQQRTSHEIHLRTDSWDSAHSSASSQRTSPVHPPQIRLSGRQSSFSSVVAQSRRFSPYGPPRDVSLLLAVFSRAPVLSISLLDAKVPCFLFATTFSTFS